MPNFLKNLYDSAEQLKGKKLIFVSILLVVISVLLGILIQNFTSRILNKSEIESAEILLEEPLERSSLSGKVSFVDPNLYPLDGISYSLVSADGEEIMLLRAEDEKLSVVEGLNVVVFGTFENTKGTGEEVMLVERIVVKNK